MSPDTSVDRPSRFHVEAGAAKVARSPFESRTKARWADADNEQTLIAKGAHPAVRPLWAHCPAPGRFSTGRFYPLRSRY